MPFSPTSWPGGGGGLTLAQAQYGGNAVTIGAGASAALTWDSHGGPALLDTFVPARPSVVTSGLYIVSLEVKTTSAFNAGRFYEILLELDADNNDPQVVTDSSAASANLVSPFLTITIASYIAAGGTLAVTATNFDTASRDIQIGNANVQLVS